MDAVLGHIWSPLMMARKNGKKSRRQRASYLWIINGTAIIPAWKSSWESIAVHLFNCKSLMIIFPISFQLNIHVLFILSIISKTMIPISVLLLLSFTPTWIAWETILKLLSPFSFLWIPNQRKGKNIIRTIRLLMWNLRVNFRSRQEYIFAGIRRMNTIS